jgi:hypothetical protein
VEELLALAGADEEIVQAGVHRYVDDVALKMSLTFLSVE